LSYPANSILLKAGKAQLHKMTNAKMSKYGIILQLIAVFLFSPFVYAQEESAPVVTERAATIQAESTSESTYEEKLKRWQSLSEEERQKIRERAKGLSPEQIKELREKSAKFRNLPKEQQDKIKANYQRFKDLPLEKKRILRERAERFQKLPPEEKAQLQRKFRERKEAPAGGPGAGPVSPAAVADWKEDVRDRKEDKKDRREDIKDRREDKKDRGPLLDKGRKPQSKPALRKGFSVPGKAPLPVRRK